MYISTTSAIPDTIAEQEDDGIRGLDHDGFADRAEDEAHVAVEGEADGIPMIVRSGPAFSSIASERSPMLSEPRARTW